MAMFVGELTDRARTLEEGLLALGDAGPGRRRQLLEELARAAHTLKGSAAMMGVRDIAAICHELEDTLGRLSPGAPVDSGLVTRLLGDVDRIRNAAPDTDGTTGSASDPAGDGSPPGGDPGSAGVPTAAVGRGSVRLPAQKLDTLIGRSTELRAATTSLLAASGRLGAVQDQLRANQRRAATADDDADLSIAAAAMVGDLDRLLRPLLRGIDRAAAGIEAAIRDVATVPVEDACDGLARAVRDIASRQQKRIQLVLSVGDAEIDRRATGVVRDALLHLVRNAADHGIEPPAERRNAGKPIEATIDVAAAVEGDRVTVTVSDDGGGINTDAVREAAAASGADPDTDAHELIFRSGLSTAAITTDVSGRGVGLDAVRERVESLGGSVSLASQPGQGTRATLRVPASLATARVLLVDVAGEQVALLAGAVQRLIRVEHASITTSNGASWVRSPEHGMLPLTSLADVAGFADGSSSTAGARAASPAVVVGGAGGTSTALLVDAVVGEQELVIQPLGPLLAGMVGIVGAGVLPRGNVVLLLHPAALLRAARQRSTRLPQAATGRDGRRRGRVLLVEDAPTTRALEQGLLEAAGLDVVLAGDGQEAWERLRYETVDVVVSDIEMPHLDGFSLCQRIRSSPTLRELPIVLVTSRGSDEDRRRGAEVGADAYLVKSSFAQGELLATIARMLA